MVRLLPCVSPSSIVTVIGSTTLCQGNVVTLNVTSGVGLTYQWQNNGVNINGATSSTYSANTAGNYTAVVTSNGCSSTSTPIAIVVNPLPNATITSSGPTSFCLGNTVLLSTAPIAGQSYQWQNNGVNIAGANASSLYVTAAGNYSLILTDNYSCSSNSDTINVILNSIPNVSLSPFIQYCDTIGIVQLSGGVPAGGNYSGNSVINNSFNTNVGTGTYLITYQYAGNNGCSSADSENLTVVNCSNNSIDDNFSYSILIYPNPTNGNITLETSSELVGKMYSILDFSGRIIREGKISSAQEHIDLQGVARGVYYLSIENGSSVIKLVKQ
jgi:hypothetical protein